MRGHCRKGSQRTTEKFRGLRTRPRAVYGAFPSTFGPIWPDFGGVSPKRQASLPCSPASLADNADMRIEPSEEARKEALLYPNGWAYQVEGTCGPNDRVPPEAIVGAWKVDGAGQIVGEFVPNPKHVKGFHKRTSQDPRP